jgi:sterol desaturase/sphingolipid hydroxylase (fatty acid hydroxylase superfamily)
METFIKFFEDMATVQLAIWVVGCLLFVWLLEWLVPLFHHDYKKVRHDGVNLAFLGMNMLVNVLVKVSTASVFVWLHVNQFGLLNWVNWPVWVEMIVAIAALDLFAQYVAHYTLHRVKWMWKFHMVHHSDTKVDATTGTRHHPGDYVIREVFAIATVVIFGIPIAFYVLYRILTIFFTYLTHANFIFPVWIDKPLSFLFITPNVHKFHHHFERPWTDTNFGNIFSIWDRAFGTFVYDDPRKIQYGLDVTDGSRDEDIGYQLGLPVNKNIKTDY